MLFFPLSLPFENLRHSIQLKGVVSGRLLKELKCFGNSCLVLEPRSRSSLIRKTDFQSVLCTLESLFAFFVFFM